MKYRIHSISVGKPDTYIFNDRPLRTAFVKKSVKEKTWLSKQGLQGDGQADLKHHGGEEKALLMYSADHYPYWETTYEKPFPIPSFGENITVIGLKEEDVSIGDTFLLGEAVIQVSEPRGPCYKIAEVNQLKDITAMVTKTGFTGFYFRVLQEGYVSPTDELELLEKASDTVSIPFIQDTITFHKKDVEQLQKILAVDTLSTDLRTEIEKKIEKVLKQ
ncbi:MOSC domain-containing protein [Radiobacillus kanasensis]|uniref:MOSC domain-containing protein n=1 Tax=Radiobacillus kanasensis TaxID=2844358 RepID=UPI001E4113F2|nr:MOSC domain-containing protein [Radiobacillus kanasensis]UFT99665.1 MOSC domain-containing protein [Radiobacillus kanasensis]